MRNRSLKDYILPHQGNGYKPLIFGVSSILAVLAVLVLIEGAYVLHTRIAFNQSAYLASVLPGVITELTNNDRAERGLAVLTPDALLTKAAQMKADDMVAKGYFAHVSPEGKTPWYWLNQVKYPYTYAGENLAVDFTDSEDVENAWVASPAHYRNLIKPEYTRIGVGVAHGMYEGHATTFVVQFFATPVKGTKLVSATQKPLRTATTTLTEVVSSTASSSSEQVLGAEIVPPTPAPTFFAQVIVSPLHTVSYVLAGLAALFTVLLIIALLVHVRIQFIEVIVAALLVITASLGLLVLNTVTSTGHVPTVSQVSPSTQTD